MPVPAIAIHGSGTREKIVRAIDSHFEGSGLYDGVETVEFDWEAVAPRTNRKGLRNLYRFLELHAANINTAARLGLEFGVHSVDCALGSIQIRLHRALHLVVSGLVAIWFVMPVVKAVVLVPAAWYGLPTRTFVPMAWMADAVTWLTIAFVAGSSVLMMFGAVRLLFTLSTRPAIITLRSIVMLVLQPVLIIVAGAFAASSLVLTAFFATITVSAFFVSGLGAAVLWTVVLALLWTLRAACGPRLLPHPLKIVLDAFRYLGEPGLRRTVQRALEHTIDHARLRTGEHDECVLVGQGLGSVIALDSLLHSSVWRKTSGVLLVTMGSPLRRYFLSLYPRTLFPEGMEHLIGAAARRVRAFWWLNIYRARDYVGGALGLEPFGGRDASTGQRGRLVGSHADYWRDVAAWRAFRQGLRRLGQIPSPHVSGKDAVHGMPRALYGHPFRMPSPARTLATGMSFLVALGWMLWWVATGSGTLAQNIDYAPELHERGIIVDASVTHRREAREHEHGLTYVHHWVFEFTDPGGVEQHLTVEHDISQAFLDIPRRFDHRALTQHIRAGCTDAERPAWLPLLRMDAPCTLDSVRLRYYPGNMMFFDLPDFPLQQFGSDPIRGWTEAGVVAGALSLLALMTLALGVRLFALLLG